MNEHTQEPRTPLQRVTHEDPDRSLAALSLVIDETRTLFHRLKAAAAQLHGQGERSGGRRGVLQSLHRQGPQTVPQMARARPVSRQHIQTLVNSLLDDGLVELIDNPAHKRSHLVGLTAAGRRTVEAMLALELRLFRVLDVGLPAEQLEATTVVLRHLGEVFAPHRIGRGIAALEEGDA